MPAIPLNADAAIIVDSAVNFEDEFGIKYEMAGLLLDNISYKPTRETIEHKGAWNNVVLTLKSNPQYVMDVSAKVTLTSSPFHAHPGATMDLATVTNFYPAIAMGFPARGHFVYGDPTIGAVNGDLYTTSFSLTLRQKPTVRLAKSELAWT